MRCGEAEGLLCQLRGNWTLTLEARRDWWKEGGCSWDQDGQGKEMQDMKISRTKDYLAQNKHLINIYRMNGFWLKGESSKLSSCQAQARELHLAVAPNQSTSSWAPSQKHSHSPNLAAGLLHNFCLNSRIFIPILPCLTAAFFSMKTILSF